MKHCELTPLPNACTEILLACVYILKCFKSCIQEHLSSLMRAVLLLATVVSDAMQKYLLAELYTYQIVSITSITKQ